MGRSQVVRVGNDTLILNTGAPQGCVVSPLLYSLFTHDSNTIIKFAVDTTVGLITDNAETTMPFPPQETEKIWHGSPDPQKVYSCTIKRILTNYITAWYGNCSASDRTALQRVVRTVQYIAGAKLPAIQDLYTRRCQRKALKIVKDSSDPSHRLFSLLPHSKWYQSAKSRSKRLPNR
jgi:hypothetical protein